MYEQIRDLPLFKGTSVDQISHFLEMTEVEFVKFDVGDVICSSAEICSHVRFVIAGEVEHCASLSDGKADLIVTSGIGTVIGALSLWGIQTHYPCNVLGQKAGSYMQIRKDQYMKLLQADEIYLINYLNYVSCNAQKGKNIIFDWCDKPLNVWLTAIRNLFNNKSVSQIRIDTTRSQLSKMFGIDSNVIETVLLEAERAGELKYSGDLTLYLM